MTRPPIPLSSPIAGWDEVRELEPRELAARLATGEPLTVLDVREHWEWTMVRVDAAQHVPLGEFARGAASLDRGAEYVIMCHHGMRSRAAASYLVDQGFRRVWNLAGGIDRYAAEVDPTLRRY